MDLPRPTRREAAVALVCATWAAAFAAGEGPAVALVLAATAALAALPYRRAPALAGIGAGAVALLTPALGVSKENPANLAIGLTAAYALGRYGLPRDVLLVAALAIALTVPQAFAAIDLVFVAFVLGATWGCGRLVRSRVDRADRAAATAAGLAAQDAGALAAAVVADERARLAGATLAVVRDAVGAMHREATAAAATIDPERLATVQARGRSAVAELRRLLGLLRSEEMPDPAERTPPAPHRWGARTVDAFAALALVALGAVETAAFGDEETAASVALTVALLASVALRRLDVVIACVAAAVPAALSVALDAPLAFGFAATIAIGLLAWSAGADGRPRALAALGVLALAAVLASHAAEPGSEGMLLVIVAFPAVAGRLWSARTREGDASLATADRLRETQRLAAERAVRAERLRLARELHDVASHAVGVMVLQAGAAVALRERSPDAAREAVREVERAGAAAIVELDVLFGVLDAGAIGGSGLMLPTTEPGLEPPVRALVERIRRAGLNVELHLAEPEPGVSQDVTAVALRVVQEGLTNAARYAPGSHVRVDLRPEDGALVVAVRDDGPGDPGHDPGFGLVGLAERVRTVDGDLDAGPRNEGGFAVVARLPVTTVAGAPA